MKKNNNRQNGFTQHHKPSIFKIVRDGAGFTLTELLVVIAILGVLFSITYLVHTDSLRKADDTERVFIVKAMQDAIELYIEDNGLPPEVKIYILEKEIWDSFVADISIYMDNIPEYSPGLNFVFGYCSDPNDRDDYLIGTLLDFPREYVGDIDGEQTGYNDFKCIFNTGQQALTKFPICNDDDSGYFRNNFGPVFCLGYERVN